ncbi:FKBP-type peptidyl-prolyl cis-trans isomerase [Erwinia aphidicola]|nr:FKBP-type peptidyl-prolyl cis-trans isomerase [Erwinia aphidicola]
MAFSQEVLRTIDINSALGIRTDKKALIAGFSDKMNGALKYSTGALLAAMSEKQKEVAIAREKTLALQVQQGNSAVMRFQASPGVVKTPQGFLYRIERRGDAPLKKDVPLRFVVKESLADGTSLLDMVADGSELRQSVDEMPPIFKEVIRKMAVNGSATIMVPPELAYGEEGKPPHIPPGATLIYWFEIRGY